MKIVTIINPTSGNKDINLLQQELLKHFAKFDFEIWQTKQSLHAIDLAQEAASREYDIVIAAGGDGTVIEVISGLINSKSKLGIIPYGTGNMLAANLGIPTANISRAIDIILENHTQKIDIGKINGRYFAFMAGCGFDAKIINETSRDKKRKYGLLAYFAQGILQAFKPKYSSFKIKLDNKKVIKTRGLAVLVANSGNIIGNTFSIAPQASLSDGLLDVIVISPKRSTDYLPILWQIFTKQYQKDSNKIKHYQVQEVEIKCKPSMLVQADGDIIDKTPVKIQAIPEAIEIFTPKEPINPIILSIEDHLKNIIKFALTDLR
ncbi:MAG: hypothetical protein ACD_20C00338G0003 [uncultured bacterium]|nr:MAG: hypothetical protein ACD_20C00338G0003 [uncultured bacterium]HBH18341.1 hypothetical protein [Cyanobacteria bacterium UBA9579]